MGCFGPYRDQKRPQGLFQYLRGYIGPYFWSCFGSLQYKAFWLTRALRSHFRFLKLGLVLSLIGPNRTQGLSRQGVQSLTVHLISYSTAVDRQGILAHRSYFGFFKHGLFWSLDEPKQNRQRLFQYFRGCYIPHFSAVFAKLKGKIETIANLIEKTH